MRGKDRRDKPDLHARLRTVTGRVVLTLAGISFAVSAVALTSLAMDHGLPWILAWTLPVVLDGLAIAGGLMVFSRTLDGDSTKYGWFLIILGTGASVAGNVLHAGDTLPPEATDGAVLVAQVIAGGFPVAMLAAFEGFLLEMKRTAKRTPLPDAPTLDAAVAEHVATVLPQLGEDLRGRLQTELEAQRVHLAEQLEAVRVDPDAIARQVDTRVDASTRQQLAEALPRAIAGQVDTLRVHLERQAESTAQRVDARVDAAVRDQVRAALPGVTEELSAHISAELEALRSEAASTTVQRIDTRRELHGQSGDAPRVAIVATYWSDPNRDWSKRSLAKAAGYERSTTVAQDVLDKAKSGQLPRPDASTQGVQEAAS